jgi:hypothetical protein
MLVAAVSVPTAVAVRRGVVACCNEFALCVEDGNDEEKEAAARVALPPLVLDLFKPLASVLRATASTTTTRTHWLHAWWTTRWRE